MQLHRNYKEVTACHKGIFVTLCHLLEVRACAPEVLQHTGVILDLDVNDIDLPVAESFTYLSRFNWFTAFIKEQI